MITYIIRNLEENASVLPDNFVSCPYDGNGPFATSSPGSFLDFNVQYVSQILTD
jgi:hypothetical protein